MTQLAIPFMQFRGGSSKGLFFLNSDLPECEVARNQVLLDAVGRDSSQIDGLGGGQSITSKVAIVSLSKDVKADIDFLFVQVVVGQNKLDTTPNCGNILAGVGAFALESKLIEAQHPKTKIRVNMLNTNKLCDLVIQTPNGQIEYTGDQSVDGVPGTSAPILCNYLDVAGAVTGALFPTNNKTDSVLGIDVTCIDNGMPVVLIDANQLNLNGDEFPNTLDDNQTLRNKLEEIRLAISDKMNISDAVNKAVPKMCIISKAKQGGVINTRTFIPHHCHTSIGVLGAVSVATACLVKGTVAYALANVNRQNTEILSIEHPSGKLDVSIDLKVSEEEVSVYGAGIVRTARLLSKGTLFVPLRK